MGLEKTPQSKLIEFDGFLLSRLISEKQIQSTVQRLADEIHADYLDQRPILVGILKGANLFAGDLMRELGRGNPEIGRPPMPLEIDFLQVQSYSGDQSTGNVTELLGLSQEISGRHVILVEDIVDTARTLTRVKQTVLLRQPASVKVCVLLDKPDRREVPFEAIISE